MLQHQHIPRDDAGRILVIRCRGHVSSNGQDEMIQLMNVAGGWESDSGQRCILCTIHSPAGDDLHWRPVSDKAIVCNDERTVQAVAWIMHGDSGH